MAQIKCLHINGFYCHISDPAPNVCSLTLLLVVTVLLTTAYNTVKSQGDYKLHELAPHSLMSVCNENECRFQLTYVHAELLIAALYVSSASFHNILHEKLSLIYVL